MEPAGSIPVPPIGRLDNPVGAITGERASPGGNTTLGTRAAPRDAEGEDVIRGDGDIGSSEADDGGCGDRVRGNGDAASPIGVVAGGITPSEVVGSFGEEAKAADRAVSA